MKVTTKADPLEAVFAAPPRVRGQACTTCANATWKKACERIAERMRQPDPPRWLHLFEALQQEPYNYEPRVSSFMRHMRGCLGVKR